MLLPADQLVIADLAKTESGCLFLSVGFSTALFWMVDGHAVFLSGTHAGVAIDAPRAENWIGVKVGPVTVRVDLTSGSIEHNALWQLRARDGLLSVPAQTKPRGFPDTVWLKIAEIETIKDQTLYFSRWAISFPNEDEKGAWIDLVTADGSKVKSMLWPEEAQSA
jgi:hypothetical protein